MEENTSFPYPLIECARSMTPRISWVKGVNRIQTSGLFALKLGVSLPSIFFNKFRMFPRPL